MGMDGAFFVSSVMLGVGLAMDAFSVSMANGLNEPKMTRRRMAGIAGVFAGFQALMPMIGWICVHTLVQAFAVFEKAIPWIALLLLTYIGSKMIFEGMHGGEEEEAREAGLGFGMLMMQGVATSIDALSVGFTIAEYGALQAGVCAAVIALVTFIICIAGVMIGRRFGTKLAGRASILGGVILVIIGLQIFIKGVI